MHVIELMKAAMSKPMANLSVLLLVGAVIISGIGVVTSLINFFSLFGFLPTVDRNVTNAVINAAITARMKMNVRRF